MLTFVECGNKVLDSRAYPKMSHLIELLTLWEPNCVDAEKGWDIETSVHSMEVRKSIYIDILHSYLLP